MPSSYDTENYNYYWEFSKDLIDSQINKGLFSIYIWNLVLIFSVMVLSFFQLNFLSVFVKRNTSSLTWGGISNLRWLCGVR